MKTIFILSLLLVVVPPVFVQAGGPSGCINCPPGTNLPPSAGPTEVRVLQDGAYIGLGLRTPTTNRVAQGTIDMAESYAVSPAGKAFGLIVKPDRSRGPSLRSYFTSDYVWLRDAFGHQTPWTNGDWHLFITLHAPPAKPVIYQTKVHIQNHAATKYIEIDL